MKPLRITLVFLLVSAISTAQTKTNKPAKLPAVFNNARYVYVEAVDGQVLDVRLNPEDRQAIIDLDKALQDWKRYVPTRERNEADLIFVVRKGRLVQAQVGVQGGAGRQSAPGRPANAPLPGNGVGGGADVGPTDDLLEVYLRNRNGARDQLIWRRTLTHGLNPPELTLFNQLKNEIESTYPKQTASTTSKP